jgi:hypothetical protein
MAQVKIHKHGTELSRTTGNLMTSRNGALPPVRITAHAIPAITDHLAIRRGDRRLTDRSRRESYKLKSGNED